MRRCSSQHTQSVPDAICQRKTDREPVYKPPKAGIATDYTYGRKSCSMTAFLQVLGRDLVPVRNDERQLSGWILPRYHQLTVRCKLVAAVLAHGPGNTYRIQHSAGSGRTNAIASTAHFVAGRHDGQDRKLFDTVSILADRTVLDDQLHETIMAFERTPGVVAVVSGGPVPIWPADQVGPGQVQDKTKVDLAELIERVNDLFEGDLTAGDKLVYLNEVITGGLMESAKPIAPASNNTQAQSAASPDLTSALDGAAMNALAAHSAMSKQAPESASATSARRCSNQCCSRIPSAR